MKKDCGKKVLKKIKVWCI